MEITYDTGAKVILQGPVTYEVESNGGYLSVGKLTGKLEKRSGEWPSGSGAVNHKSKSQVQIPVSLYPPSLPSPFVIRTPTATVTDLGTEFGVEVDAQQVCHVETFVGLVEVRQLPEANRRLVGPLPQARPCASTLPASWRKREPSQTNLCETSFDKPTPTRNSCWKIGRWFTGRSTSRQMPPALSTVRATIALAIFAAMSGLWKVVLSLAIADAPPSSPVTAASKPIPSPKAILPRASASRLGRGAMAVRLRQTSPWRYWRIAITVAIASYRVFTLR